MENNTKPGTDWHNDDIETLFSLDMAIATKDGINLLTKLCNDFFKDAFDNQGIRIGGKARTAIIGHKYYSQAMSDWKKWDINI